MNSSNQLFTARLSDAVKSCENKNIPRFIGFLTENELSSAISYADKNYIKYAYSGGYDGAERVIFAVLPDWAQADDVAYPIMPVTITYKPEYELSHRDFLGTLMSLGITREKVGDIVVGRGNTVVFLHSDVADYVLSQLEKVGGVGVSAEVGCGAVAAEREYQPIRSTVASNRLDCIVAALCNTSREKSSQIIAAKTVFVDNVLCVNTSQRISGGASLTIRGHGKYIIDSAEDVTRKGRTVLSARKLV